MAIARIINEPTAAAGTYTRVYSVQGSPFVVMAHIDDAVGGGELGALTVRPVARDLSTVLPTVITPTTVEGPTFASGVEALVNIYDLAGIDTVEVSIVTTVGPRELYVDLSFVGG